MQPSQRIQNVIQLKFLNNMIIHLHPINPEIRKLKQISEALKEGEIFIFPTDTVYALVADSSSKKGIEKLYDLKKIDKKHHLSLFCSDIARASTYIEYMPNYAYKIMKRLTPGPYVFVFKANKNISRIALPNEKTRHIGIRIPNNKAFLSLLDVHDTPLVSTSVFTNDEFIIDVDSLEDTYGHRISGIIDGGIVETELSTVVDFTEDQPQILREGKGIEEIQTLIQS